MKKPSTKLSCLLCIFVLLLLPLLINPAAVRASGTGEVFPLESDLIGKAVLVPTGSEMGAVSAGWYHTCVLTTDEGVMCWGSNSAGLLGNDSTTSSLIPVNVSALSSGVSAVSAGENKSCALTDSGGAKCWGSNYIGQLGNNSTDMYSDVPVDVWELTSGVKAVAVGDWHACALTTAGNVKCWGGNFKGELGNNTTIHSRIPVDVVDLPLNGVKAIAAGGEHTCALTTTGGVKCWGQNSSGQLGTDTPTDYSTHPVDVTGLSSGVSAIAAGTYNTCALTTTGGVKCWGWGSSGQLGNNNWDSSTIPVNVSGLSTGVKAIAVGSYHVCALTSAGGVKCWGYGYYGELGNNSTNNRNTPVNVIGLSSGVIAITAGFEHTCALTMAGWVQCWGYNYFGQLGNNSTNDSSVPVDVLGFGPQKFSFTVNSTGTYDGWILESGENSNVGGMRDSTATTFNLGDGVGDRQYRAVLSFNTASLPDNAVITKVTLKIKKQGVAGTNPFSILGGLKFDIRKPFFGTTLVLVAGDFQAAPGKSGVGTFGTTPVSNWYSADIGSAGYPYIHKAGTTQFRLYFTKDDNDDGNADYMKFYSGNYAYAAMQPILIVEYYVP